MGSLVSAVDGSIATLPNTGLGVRIGLVDTGVDSRHPDLLGKITANYEVVMGYLEPFIDPVSRGTDQNQHGTACAGILHRMAPEAEIHSVQVIGEHVRDSPEKLIAGIQFAVEQGWEVININAGAGLPHAPLHQAIKRAYDAGTLLVAAKDNRPGAIGYPAAYPEVIAVDMEHFTDATDWSYFAGAEVEVEAKGVYIEAPVPNGGRQSFTGASFAAPHIAGIAARFKQAHPEMGMPEFREFLAENQVGQD